MSGLSNSDVAQLYRNMGKQPPDDLGVHTPAEKIRAHKYGAIKKELDGHKFASTIEAEAYRLLRAWEHMGVIRNLELQPKFVLQKKQMGMRAIGYIADFRFEIDCGPDGWRSRVVDIKGYRPAVFAIKEKLFRAKFPDVDLQVWDRAKVKELSRC